MTNCAEFRITDNDEEFLEYIQGEFPYWYENEKAEDWFRAWVLRTRNGDWEQELGIDDKSLCQVLNISDAMLNAMCVVLTNIRNKIHTRDKERNLRYVETWDAVVSGSVFEESFPEQLFSGLNTCDGGDEVGILYVHPIVGVHHRMLADEYRVRTAPYVAAFGVELYPGDEVAGLVLQPEKLHPATQ